MRRMMKETPTYEELIRKSCEEVNVAYIAPNQDKNRKKKLYRAIAKRRAKILAKARLQSLLENSPELFQDFMELKGLQRSPKLFQKFVKLQQLQNLKE
mmetsp:Transcript_16931/g.25616  ORF Transcript_16931/g.25616 Transcript_16931/m.25616 type:complete len:98 (-) Transcript_16931:82-375(-)